MKLIPCCPTAAELAKTDTDILDAAVEDAAIVPIATFAFAGTAEEIDSAVGDACVTVLDSTPTNVIETLRSS